MDTKDVGSNWKKLQAQLIKEKTFTGDKTLKRKKPDEPSQPQNHAIKKQKRTTATPSHKSTMTHEPPQRSKSLSSKPSANGTPSLPKTTSTTNLSTLPPKPPINCGRTSALAGKYLALDCEMVGVAPDPTTDSMLARVSLVNYHGDLIYDSFVLPQEPVLDYRTHVSGVSPQHLRPGYARPFADVQADVAELLKGKILVGHALRNDEKVLFLSHPKRDVRDTARHAEFRKHSGGMAPSLKKLAGVVLGWEIQGGEHSSIEDARACMALFQREKEAFEREHVRVWGLPKKVVEKVEEVREKAKKKKKKAKRKK